MKGTPMVSISVLIKWGSFWRSTSTPKWCFFSSLCIAVIQSTSRSITNVLHTPVFFSMNFLQGEYHYSANNFFDGKSRLSTVIKYFTYRTVRYFAQSIGDTLEGTRQYALWTGSGVFRSVPTYFVKIGLGCSWCKMKWECDNLVHDRTGICPKV